MKKLLAIFVALFVLCGAISLAEEASEMNWADVEPLAETWNGQFYELDGLDLLIYIPGDMEYVEDEDYFATFSDADQTKMVAVMVDEADVATLEDFGAAMTESGATDIEYCVVNGLPSVSYMFENTVCMSFLTDGGYHITFLASPVSSEEVENVDSFTVQAAVILASIQAKE